MRKNSKKESTNGTAAASNAVAPVEAAGPAARTPAKAARKTVAKAPAKKAPAKKAAAKKSSSPARKPTTTAAPNEPSDADIRLRAYFIAEKRAAGALPGDPANDWIEARKELRQEAGLA